MIKNVMAKAGDRVMVDGMTGTLHRIRFDDNGDEIYTVILDQKFRRPVDVSDLNTQYGFYYARHSEVTWL